MKTICAAILIGAFAAVQTVWGSFQTGVILEDVRCKAQPKYSYLLYLPEDYDPNREEPWPVMFIMAPKGGTPALLKRFVSGAELNGWILAMSVQSGEQVSDSEAAVLAMFNDVLATFSTAENQCYAAGIRHGADMAYMLAAEYPDTIIGLLPGNALIPDRSIKIPTYLYCRASLGNRQRIVVNRRNLKDESVIEFYAGEQNAAPHELYSFAMLWLQSQFLNENGTPEQAAACSVRLYRRIKMLETSDPYAAYRLAELLGSLRQFPDRKKAEAAAEALEDKTDIQHWLKAREAMEKFIDEYLNLMPREYEMLYRNSEEPEKDAAKFYAAFGDTPFAEIVNELARKTAKQHTPYPY